MRFHTFDMCVSKTNLDKEKKVLQMIIIAAASLLQWAVTLNVYFITGKARRVESNGAAFPSVVD